MMQRAASFHQFARFSMSIAYRQSDSKAWTIGLRDAPFGVAPGGPRGGLLTGRSLWIGGSDELPGYGTYAYLLLASLPHEPGRERHPRYWAHSCASSATRPNSNAARTRARST